MTNPINPWEPPPPPPSVQELIADADTAMTDWLSHQPHIKPHMQLAYKRAVRQALIHQEMFVQSMLNEGHNRDYPDEQN